MMHGPSLPILFPIGFVSFIITYFVEIFMLFYVYKLPITYDETLHLSVLKYLKHASIMAFAFNFWVFSNQ